MKIRTQFRINITIFVASFLVLSIAWLVTNNREVKIYRQVQTVRTIEQTVDTLNFLSNAYLLYRQDDQAARWQTTFAEMSANLATVSVDTPAEQDLLNRLNASQQNLRAAFTSIASDSVPVAPSADRNDAVRFLATWSRLQEPHQKMIADASLLADQLLTQTNQMQQSKSALVMMLMLTFGAYLFSHYLVVNRRILGSLRELRHGVAKISNGNLNFTFDVQHADEISELALAFNRMTRNLQETTASKSDLANEIAERQRVEDQLIESHHRTADILSSIRDGFFALNRQWCFVYVNQHAAEIIQMTPEQMIGKNIWELFPALKGTALEHAYRQAMELQIPSRFETSGIYQQAMYDVNVYPSAEGISVYWVDITERKNTERALRESEERFAGAFRSSPTAFAISRVADGTYIDANEAACQLYGYALTELIGHRSIELGIIEPAERQRIFDALRNHGAIRNMETVITTKTGERRNVLFGMQVININGEVCALTTLNDITDRTRAEEAVRLSEERFRVALDNLPIVFFTQDRELRYSWLANPHPSFDNETVLGRSDADLLPPDDAQVLIEFKQQVMATGTGGRREVRTTIQGEPYYYELFAEPLHDAAGNIVGVSCASLDITERKRAEEKLRASEERFRSLVNSLSDIVYTLDTEQRHTALYGSWTDRLGYAPEHFIGKTARDLFGEAAAIHEQANARALAGETNVYDWSITTDTGTRYYHTSVAPLRNAAGEIVGVVGVGRDISDLMKAEMELQKRETVLTQAGQMAHLGAWEIDLRNADDVNANTLVWSDEVYRIFGYAPGAVAVTNDLFFAHVHPDDRQGVSENIAQAIASHTPYNFEHRIVRPDGTERIVQEYAEVFYDNDNQPARIIGAVQDVTEERIARKELNEIQRRTEDVFQSVQDPFYVLDANWILKMVNGATERMWGIPKEQLIGRSLLEIFPQMIGTETHRQAERTMQERVVVHYETFSPIVHKWISAHCYPLSDGGMTVFFNDITETKRAQEQIAMLARFTDESPNPILRLDSEGKVLFANRAAQPIIEEWGCTADKPVPFDWRLEINRVLVNREPRVTEVELCDRSYTFALIPVIEAGYVNLYGTDITERKQAEQSLAQANRDLQEWTRQLGTRNQELLALGKMSEFLQASHTPQEAYNVLQQFAKEIFAEDCGALYIFEDAKRVQAQITWGEDACDLLPSMFAPDECWALRRGRTHVVVEFNDSLVCEHVAHHHSSRELHYICVPLTAQGEIMGVLHLMNPRNELSTAKQQLVITATEQLALALASIRLREQLRDQAIRDSLTGLFNRRYFSESLDLELHRARRHEAPVSVIILDLDHFKVINDTYGHDAGDAVLQLVAHQLQTHVRQEDIVCRYGGEEFGIILPNTPLMEAHKRAEILRQGVQDVIASYQGQTVGTVSASIGIACYPQHGKTAENIVSAADGALYEAKTNGRNCVVLAK